MLIALILLLTEVCISGNLRFDALRTVLFLAFGLPMLLVFLARPQPSKIGQFSKHLLCSWCQVASVAELIGQKCFGRLSSWESSGVLGNSSDNLMAFHCCNILALCSALWHQLRIILKKSLWVAKLCLQSLKISNESPLGIILIGLNLSSSLLLHILVNVFKRIIALSRSFSFSTQNLSGFSNSVAH